MGIFDDEVEKATEEIIPQEEDGRAEELPADIQELVRPHPYLILQMVPGVLELRAHLVKVLYHEEHGFLCLPELLYLLFQVLFC